MSHLSPEGSLPQGCSSVKLPFKFSDDGEVASEKKTTKDVLWELRPEIQPSSVAGFLIQVEDSNIGAQPLRLGLMGDFL